jgi:hypothetical protein
MPTHRMFRQGPKIEELDDDEDLPDLVGEEEAVIQVLLKSVS